MPSIPHIVVVALAAMLLFPGALGAQSDEETVNRYRLTESAYAKYVRAARNMIAAWKADPAAFKEEEDEGDSETSIAEIAAMYDAHPAAQRAIMSAGMSTREFVTFTFAMFQAAVGAWAAKQQQGKLDDLPAGVLRENVQFYQRHEAELQRLTEEMQQIVGEKNEEPAEGDPPPAG